MITKKETQKQEPGQLKEGVKHHFYLDTCIFLNEFSLVKKLSTSLEKHRWSGKIYVTPAVTRELKGLCNSPKKKQAKKAKFFIEKHKESPVWKFDQEKGTAIHARLETDPRIVEVAGGNDLSILAEAMHFSVWHCWKGGENRKAQVHLITHDNGLKSALRIANRGMPYGYWIKLDGTLNWFWKIDWIKYGIKKKIKRVLRKNNIKKGD